MSPKRETWYQKGIDGHISSRMQSDPPVHNSIAPSTIKNDLICGVFLAAIKVRIKKE